MTTAPSPHETPKRRVRSFVLRMGRMTPAQARALRELWPRYGIDFSQQQLNMDAIFGRRAPRLLEIGFGSGEALLAYAAAHPEQDCLGIEVHRPGVGRLLLGAAQLSLSNLRVVCHDAVEVLEHMLPASAIDTVHLFFPDPWPKKRHAKRRIVQPAFAAVLARVLRPGGLLRLATDWEPYARQMQTVLDASDGFDSLAGESGFVTRPDVRPLTRFELRGQRLGHEVWDLAYRKKESGVTGRGSAGSAAAS